MKKAKKQILGMAETTMIGAGSSIGITALGGSAAGISNATSFMPAMGSLTGAGMVMRQVGSLGGSRRRKRKH